MADTNTSIPTTEVEALTKALTAIQPLVTKISKMDRTKLTESEDKFLHIRATRLEHTIREALKGKSFKA